MQLCHWLSHESAAVLSFDILKACTSCVLAIVFSRRTSTSQDRDHQCRCRVFLVVKYWSHQPTSMLQELLSTSTVSFSRATSRNMGGGRQWKRCYIDMFFLNVFDLLSVRC